MTRRPVRQAHDPDDPWTAALWVGASVFFLLWVYVMSGAELVWPVPG